MAATSPAIVSVDDEPEVLRAVERDLRRKYGKDYRVLGTDSGGAAVDLLHQLGTRWSPSSHQLKDFLGRNQVPYQWTDVEIAAPDAEIQALIPSVDLKTASLPLVVLPGGEVLSNPPVEELAARIGLRTRAETTFYDFVIVGG